MLVSAVLDPSAFDKDCFDDLYAIHAEDFLEGIWRNGVLIIDKGGRLQGPFIEMLNAFQARDSDHKFYSLNS